MAAIPKERYVSLVTRLHEIDAVKFGEFTLKSGIVSPLYLDLRLIVSFPELLAEVADLMWESVNGVEFDLLCGVPYTALPIATALALKHRRPMLMRRKEVKDYGTKKAIEGKYTAGQNVLVVEDLVTSGASIMETVEPLKNEELAVHHAVVLIDREQGGRERLEEAGIQLHATLKMTFLIEVLSEKGLITKKVAEDVSAFLSQNRPSVPPLKQYQRLKYSERGAMTRCPMTKRCFDIMERKMTNLAVATDVTSSAELLTLADRIGPHICVLKTHVDVLDQWNDEIASKLHSMAERHDFLLFEDRKFADIGNTVVQQYSGGIYRISDWSHITNAHLIPGPGIIEGLASIGASKGHGLLLLAEMSSQGNLATGAYTTAVIEAGLKRPDYVMGFISIQPATWSAFLDNEVFRGMIHMTPGVSLKEKGDQLGQQYNTPEAVIGEKGSDVIIVGRAIIKADNPAEEAIRFKEAGWKAYESSLANSRT